MAKLFTKAVETKLRNAGPDGKKAIVKFFGGAATWVIFGSEVLDDGSEILYGIADIGFGTAEDGTVWRHELESLVNHPKCFLQRDRYFFAEGESRSHFHDYYSKRGTLAGC